MAPIIFIDCEATGLYAALGHEPWEIAWCLPDGEVQVLHPEPGLSKADPNSLRMTRFYDRLTEMGKQWWDLPSAVAADVAIATAGKHLVGAVPSFDAAILKVGVEPTQFERHTAKGDVLWAKRLYEAVMGQ